MITIKEMANMLGISTTTVSNVIHGKTGEVSKATVKKVLKIIEEYDYVPNINARNLASNCSNIIGVAMVSSNKWHKNYLEDAFIGELVGSIERALKSSGYFVMMYFAETAEELIQTVFSWNVDGMIMLGMQKDDCLKINKRYKKPQVFIDSYIEDIQISGINIGLNDRQGGYLMGKHLIDNGHKKIAFLADNQMGGDYERYCGFSEAMTEAGIHVKEEDFITIGNERNMFDECLEHIYSIVSNYTALFCASDFYALMVMNYLKDRGLKIPQDISIVGFDDNMYSKFSRPAITTIHQSPTQKGELAVQAIMDQLEGKIIENKWIVLPVELVERETVNNLIKEKNYF